MTEPSTGYSDTNVLAAYPHAEIDHDNIDYFRGLLGHRLMINRCSACQMWSAPPRGICPYCWSDDVVPTEVSGRGIVYLNTRFHTGVAGDGVDYTSPLRIVTVELVEQPNLRFTASLIDSSPDVQIGDSVKLRWILRSGAPAAAFEATSVAATR